MRSGRASRQFAILALFLAQCLLAIQATDLRKTAVVALERSASLAEEKSSLHQDHPTIGVWPPHAPSDAHYLNAFLPIDPQVPPSASIVVENDHLKHIGGQKGGLDTPSSSVYLQDVSSSRIPEESTSSSPPRRSKHSTGPSFIETSRSDVTSHDEVLRMPAIETLPLWAQRKILRRKQSSSRDPYRRKMEAIVLAMQSQADNVRLLRNSDGSGRLCPHPYGETNRQYLNLDSIRRMVPKSELHRIPSPGPFLPTRVNKEAVRPKDAEEDQYFSELAQMKPSERARIGNPDDVMLLRDRHGFFVKHPCGITNGEYFADHRKKENARQRRLRAQTKQIYQILRSQSSTPKAMDAQERISQSHELGKMLQARYDQKQRLLQLAGKGEVEGPEPMEASDNGSASKTWDMLADDVACKGSEPPEDLHWNGNMPILRVDRGMKRGKQGARNARERPGMGKQASSSTRPSRLARVAQASDRWPRDWILACVKRLKGYTSCYDRARFNLPKDAYMVWNRKLSQWESSGITNAEWLENRKEQMQTYNKMYRARKRREGNQAAAPTVSPSHEV